MYKYIEKLRPQFLSNILDWIFKHNTYSSLIFLILSNIIFFRLLFANSVFIKKKAT